MHRYFAGINGFNTIMVVDMKTGRCLHPQKWSHLLPPTALGVMSDDGAHVKVFGADLTAARQELHLGSGNPKNHVFRGFEASTLEGVIAKLGSTFPSKDAVGIVGVVPEAVQVDGKVIFQGPRVYSV